MIQRRQGPRLLMAHWECSTPAVPHPASPQPPIPIYQSLWWEIPRTRTAYQWFPSLPLSEVTTNGKVMIFFFLSLPINTFEVIFNNLDAVTESFPGPSLSSRASALLKGRRKRAHVPWGSPWEASGHFCTRGSFPLASYSTCCLSHSAAASVWAAIFCWELLLPCILFSQLELQFPRDSSHAWIFHLVSFVPCFKNVICISVCVCECGRTYRTHSNHTPRQMLSALDKVVKSRSS